MLDEEAECKKHGLPNSLLLAVVGLSLPLSPLPVPPLCGSRSNSAGYPCWCHCCFWVQSGTLCWPLPRVLRLFVLVLSLRNRERESSLYASLSPSALSPRGKDGRGSRDFADEQGTGWSTVSGAVQSLMQSVPLARRISRVYLSLSLAGHQRRVQGKSASFNRVIDPSSYSSRILPPGFPVQFGPCCCSLQIARNATRLPYSDDWLDSPALRSRTYPPSATHRSGKRTRLSFMTWSSLTLSIGRA